MDMTSVSSSNIAAVGYVEDTMQVEFHNGTVYQYFDVPEHVFEELRDAGSVGQYFNMNVKGVFRFSKV